MHEDLPLPAITNTNIRRETAQKEHTMEETELYALLAEALHSTQKGLARPATFRNDLVLLGEGGELDSLDTMLFLGEAEDQLRKRLGWDIEIVNSESLGQTASPFRAMNSLAGFILGLIREREAALHDL